MWIDSPRRAVSRLARVRAVSPTDQPRRGRIAVAFVLALMVLVAAVAALSYASTPQAKAAILAGDFNGAHAHVGGATVMPASALWWSF